MNGESKGASERVNVPVLYGLSDPEEEKDEDRARGLIEVEEREGRVKRKTITSIIRQITTRKKTRRQHLMPPLPFSAPETWSFSSGDMLSSNARLCRIANNVVAVCVTKRVDLP